MGTRTLSDHLKLMDEASGDNVIRRTYPCVLNEQNRVISRHRPFEKLLIWCFINLCDYMESGPTISPRPVLAHRNSSTDSLNAEMCGINEFR
jgi:hypothetical protein